MKVSKPNDIVLERLNYNSRTPQQYFDELSERLSAFDVIFHGFIIEDKWKGNSTLTSFEYDGVVYHSYRINKLYRYIKRMETNGFVKPKGLTLTPEILTQKVIDECANRDSMEFIGYDTYNGARTYLKLRCNSTNHNEPHEWDSTIYDAFIHKHTECPMCNGKYRYSIDELNENIIQYCNEKGFKNPTLITLETMKGVNSRVQFTCHCGEYADMTYDSLTRSRFCLVCSEGSYKKRIPGSVYVLSVYYENNLIGYKFGISNNVDLRLKAYGVSPCDVELIHQYDFDDGYTPVIIENNIKNKLKTTYITKDTFGTGYTETISPCLYDELIDIIKKGA